MDYGRFRCRHCRKLRRKRTRDQRYCGESACQKARKNAWRREKYAEDADYRANQRDSTNAWLEKSGGAAAYHRVYRKRRKPKATAKPVAAATEEGSANSDAAFGKNTLKSGVYTLIPIPLDKDANSDAYLARIDLIAMG
jgi:hypothetical protein